MANAWRRTASQMETAVRTNLDEATAAFWTQANIWTFLTRAAHAVGTEVRKLKADYFLKSLESDDGSVTIYGESYATSSFAIVAGTKEYTLPGDLLELKAIECITSGYEGVQFQHLDLASKHFRSARAITDNQPPVNFFFDIVGERTLTIAPKSDTALDLRLWYVSSVVLESTAGASIMDISATTDQLVIPHPGYMAVEEVATARALLKDRDVTAAVYAQLADASVARLFSANARQTQDPEYAVGIFEDW